MNNEPIRTRTNSELNIFNCSARRYESDAAYAYRNHEPQMKAPRVAPRKGAFTYGFAIRVKKAKTQIFFKCLLRAGEFEN